MHPPTRTPARSWLLEIGVCLFWLLFTVIVVTTSWVGTAFRGRPFDLWDSVAWNFGFILWAGLSFLVIWLARRIPAERGRLGRAVALHVFAAVAVVLVALGVELALYRAFLRLWAANPRPIGFVGFLAYKFHVYLLVYWLVWGATRAYDYHIRYRESAVRASQLETRLAEARLRVLQTQLQPHFLFNTHHSIISLMLQGEVTPAVKMLTRLSDLLRLTLQQNAQQVTTLREELAALDLYLEIQKERFRQRLTVRKEMAEEVLAAEVPALILQPLVENALKHGIEPLPEGGVVTLCARRAGDRLHLVVRDNGRGLPPDFSMKTAAGIGLANCEARLRELYGPAHRFEVAPVEGGGTQVCLELPFQWPARKELVEIPSLPHA